MNAASASPRASSSATIAASTAEAHGPPSSEEVRSSRHSEPAIAASSLAGAFLVVELADRVRREPIDRLCRRVAQGLLLGGEADVHRSASQAAGEEASTGLTRTPVPGALLSSPCRSR